MPPRCRRHDPRRAITLGHNTALLRQGPPAPRSCRDHLQPRDGRHRRMLSHTPMSQTLSPLSQGGPPRTNTTVAAQREEIARLKGLKGRPALKPSGMEKASEPKPPGSRKGRRGPVRPRVAVEDQVIAAPVPPGATHEKVWQVLTD